MPKFISDPKYEVDASIFDAMLEVTYKIGVYWVLNYELPLNPDYDGQEQEVDKNGIQIGTIVMINMMMQIAFGKEIEEGYFYNELKRTSSFNK
jgi:hypothetical protein